MMDQQWNTKYGQTTEKKRQTKATNSGKWRSQRQKGDRQTMDYQITDERQTNDWLKTYKGDTKDRQGKTIKDEWQTKISQTSTSTNIKRTDNWGADG